MTKLTGKGFTDTWMELFMKENGETINLMVKENKRCRMVHITKAIL